MYDAIEGIEKNTLVICWVSRVLSYNQNCWAKITIQDNINHR